MPTVAQRADFERRLTLAADLAREHRTEYPRAARYVAAHGRLPGWALDWGNARPLTNGDGWAARLWGAGVPLSAVTIRTPPRTAANLDSLPGDRLAAMLRLFAQTVPHRPTCGAVCPEWSSVARWHWHGILTTEEADNLAAALVKTSPLTPNYPESETALGTLHAEGINNLDEFKRSLTYMHKRIRQDLPPLAYVMHAERLLRFRAERGGRQLPRLTTVYG